MEIELEFKWVGPDWPGRKSGWSRQNLISYNPIISPNFWRNLTSPSFESTCQFGLCLGKPDLIRLPLPCRGHRREIISSRTSFLTTATNLCKPVKNDPVGTVYAFTILILRQEFLYLLYAFKKTESVHSHNTRSSNSTLSVRFQRTNLTQNFLSHITERRTSSIYKSYLQQGR